jgi:hypothetical protein
VLAGEVRQRVHYGSTRLPVSTASSYWSATPGSTTPTC